MSWTGEIEPATLEQIRMGRDGKTHVITQDAGGIAQRLREIDHRLHLRYSELGEYYVVYAREDDQPEGTGYMVATYQTLDARIIKDIERIKWLNEQPGYSYADELEKKNEEAEAKREHDFSEKIKENAEELAWAIRKDLGDQGRIVVEKDVPSE
jgi:predicted restriction endonuclease